MRCVMKSSISSQQGFTLIELMISLVLGLLISAAVIQVFITSQRVDRIQAAGSEIQDKAVFGLQSIEPQVRLANLGNDGVALNDKTLNGGVVLTASKTETNSANVITTANRIEDGYITRSFGLGGSSDKENSWIATLTNTEVHSDQLTIQYTNITGSKIYDCEGKEVEEGERVITRYFVTPGNLMEGSAIKNLNLNCDAGRIKNKELKAFTDKGVTVIENIDQFNIRLGVQEPVVIDDETSYQYADMTVKEYMSLPTTTDKPRPPIVNIRIAILARSTANSPEASAKSFEIFGATQTLKTQTNAPKYLRRVYESNILLRNARVMRIIDNSSDP